MRKMTTSDDFGGVINIMPEDRWNFLLETSRAVLKTFRHGRNPSFTQLDKLEAAIECVQAEKICGHREIEDCECEE